MAARYEALFGSLGSSLRLPHLLRVLPSFGAGYCEFMARF
jgi:hypothetical protein